MKFRILSLAVAALLVNSCTKIVEAPDDSTEINNLSTARKAIMFKFTGVNCGACSAYHPIYEEFVTENAENRGKIVGLHVHCGVSDTLNTNFSLSFTNRFDIPGTPRFAEGTIMLQDTAYDVVKPMALLTMEKTADVGIGFSHKISGNLMTIKTKTQFFNDMSGEYSLAVYVIENKCWADQVGIGSIEHNRILRGSANGMWGTVYAPGVTTKGNVIDHTWTYDIGTVGINHWNPDNLRVLVIVYKMSNGDPVEVANCNWNYN